MSGRPVKHSLTLRGHRTSVSLEDAFWQEFRRIARARGVALNELATEIDERRETRVGLASAIRVFVLEQALSGMREAAPRTGPVTSPER